MLAAGLRSIAASRPRDRFQFSGRLSVCTLVANELSKVVDTPTSWSGERAESTPAARNPRGRAARVPRVTRNTTPVNSLTVG